MIMDDLYNSFGYMGTFTAPAQTITPTAGTTVGTTAWTTDGIGLAIMKNIYNKSNI